MKEEIIGTFEPAPRVRYYIEKMTPNIVHGRQMWDVIADCEDEQDAKENAQYYATKLNVRTRVRRITFEPVIQTVDIRSFDVRQNVSPPPPAREIKRYIGTSADRIRFEEELG